MKCSLAISNFLEEISNLSHSTVFLYFFALITEEGFLISPCYSFALCIQMDISFSPLPFTSLLFSAIYKASSDNHLTFLHFFFLGMVLITASCTILWTSAQSSSGTLSIRQNENHNHRKLNWSHGAQPCLTQWNYEPCHAGPPKRGHGREFWQNMVHWGREWQATLVFLPWEPHEQYEKAKRYNTERWTLQIDNCPICYWRKVDK